MILEIDAVLAAARLLLPVREIAGQNNRGRFVEAIIASTGNKPGDAWCASAVYYLGRGILGARWPLPRTASCDELLKFARAREILRPSPRRGDVFLRLHTDTDAVHTGFVDETPDPSQPPKGFRVLHGNSNGAGSRDGDGFHEGRLGGPSDPYRYVFARWADLLKET